MWPNYFPDDCPPEDAKEKNICVYRLVNHNPPTSEDFLSTYELQPGRRFNNLSLACGISCYTDYEQAVQQNELLSKSTYFIRKNLPKMKLAKGHTDPRCGVVKETPASFPSHVTYWLRKNVSVEHHFEVI